MQRFGFLFAGFIFFSGVSVADDDSDKKETEQSRTEFLLERADLNEIQLVREDGTTVAAARIAEPALKYQNPLYEEQSDGVLLIWTIDSLPIAFASYSIRSEKKVFKEFAISSDEPLRCFINGALVWAPQPQFTRRPIGKDIPVPNNDRQRLRIMKRLAERFESGKKRVLTTPLYRYCSEKGNVIDGAVFTLSDTNDPEMLVLVEAFEPESDGKAQWRYTVARMNSQPQEVYLEDELIWELKGYWRNPRSITDPYLEGLDTALPTELSLSPKE